MIMNRLFTFFLGMVVGALTLYFILYLRTNSEEERLREQLIETITGKLAEASKQPEIQYIDVKGRKGNVTVYTGMSKDSVKLLLGKSDEVNLYEIGNIHHEKWGYRLKNQYVSDLEIEFENGKLSGVRQN